MRHPLIWLIVAVSHQGYLGKLLMEAVMEPHEMVGECRCQKDNPFGTWEHPKMTERDGEWLGRLGKCADQQNDRFGRGDGKAGERDVRTKPQTALRSAGCPGW